MEKTSFAFAKLLSMEEGSLRWRAARLVEGVSSKLKIFFTAFKMLSPVPQIIGKIRVVADSL